MPRVEVDFWLQNQAFGSKTKPFKDKEGFFPDRFFFSKTDFPNTFRGVPRVFPRLCATPTTASHVRCPPPSQLPCPPPSLLTTTSVPHQTVKPKISKSTFLMRMFWCGPTFGEGGGSGKVEEGGVCAKRRRGRASHVRGSRRGRAEAREHAGDIPTCPGKKSDSSQKFHFRRLFLPSLNGLRLAHLD